MDKVGQGWTRLEKVRPGGMRGAAKDHVLWLSDNRILDLNTAETTRVWPYSIATRIPPGLGCILKPFLKHFAVLFRYESVFWIKIAPDEAYRNETCTNRSEIVSGIRKSYSQLLKRKFRHWTRTARLPSPIAFSTPKACL